jgi:MoaD family protein
MPVVKLYASLRKLAGVKELPITGATLEAVLNGLVKQNPALDGTIFEDGQLRQHFVITINGYNVSDLETSVTDQDIVAIFPPIACG